MRADWGDGIVPVMSGRTQREIRDHDVQGLKYLRKLRPLLSRLRTVGASRDKAGNRRLFMDQYCALILMSLFSPAIESLRPREGPQAARRQPSVLGIALGIGCDLRSGTAQGDRC